MPHVLLSHLNISLSLFGRFTLTLNLVLWIGNLYQNVSVPGHPRLPVMNYSFAIVLCVSESVKDIFRLHACLQDSSLFPHFLITTWPSTTADYGSFTIAKCIARARFSGPLSTHISCDVVIISAVVLRSVDCIVLLTNKLSDCHSTVANAKQEHLFSQIQSIYDLTKQTSDPNILQQLLVRAKSTQRLRQEFSAILDLELKVDADYTPNYPALASVNELVDYFSAIVRLRSRDKLKLISMNLTDTGKFNLREF
ncbi:hypothetical protein J6590_012571 [Homalodisca vitripennis]|nr:hypothetical protein J6590_012571 [Homalodisca vitripennis]